MHAQQTQTDYSGYLKLDQLLDSQKRKSQEYGMPAHDEMLFIIVHQVYELWFKQILFELDTVLAIFAQNHVNQSQASVALARLERITGIQRLLVEQINILGSMTPLDFLDFRDYLIPASGFQSVQFRAIEIKLGLCHDQRVDFDRMSFYFRYSQQDREKLQSLEAQPSLFTLIEHWLEAIPKLQNNNFDFWQAYQSAVQTMLSSDQEIIAGLSMSDKEKNQQLKGLQATRHTFECLLDSKKYQHLITKGQVRLSHKGMLAAVFIHLYRDIPALHLPYELISKLIEIDELQTTWRYRHGVMVHRMLGEKIGTGGSSGHSYLNKTTQGNRIFRDFFNIATFLIPRSRLPDLPAGLIDMLSRHFSQNGTT